MRRIFKPIQTVGVIAAAALCVLFAAFLSLSPVFEGGTGYELYLGASSSALTVRTENPALDKFLLGNVAGESVRYEGNRLEEIAKKYHAEVLFTEEAAGVVNYYCYSSYLGGCVLLDGYAVNLHIAVSAEQTAAGTPLIFGGF